MIKFSAAPEFDFNEWATLYERDPAAFEARRRAMLAIELARGGRHAAPARAMLQRLEAQLEGKSDADRARLSLLAMVASAKQMSDRLGELSLRLEARQALSALPPGPQTRPAQPIDPAQP